MTKDLSSHQPEVERLSGEDASSFRDLRLDGLKRHPEAFGSSWEQEASFPTGWFAERLERTVVFGVRNVDLALDAVVGLFVPEGVKQQHKGVLWGMYVRPEARSLGLGSALVSRVVTHATAVVEELRFTVASPNDVALRLYLRAGFERYGVERRAL